MNAMLGLEPVAAGQILFNGVAVSTGISASIIDQVSVAPQSAQVMSGTLRDNVCYGIEYEPPADTILIDILRILNFTEQASTRLINLDIRLDSRGEGLSGGERQQIAIARRLPDKRK
ncbi:ATP-binding cassette domain-containing protein [Advenella kashmirensis]|uniref:ATP-binding cassette domain-containing protein n=1 Tax=Advenella kashmirensis TaxID=310575 RepID=UPI0005A06FD8|nr:ATP-binding cassette domain-containing protein [Advenella kashmirensis]